MVIRLGTQGSLIPLISTSFNSLETRLLTVPGRHSHEVPQKDQVHMYPRWVRDTPIIPSQGHFLG